MPDNKPTISFQLPQSKTVEVYLVTLPDGSVVARTAAELQKLPQDLKPHFNLGGSHVESNA